MGKVICQKRRGALASGISAIADQIKATTCEAVRQLKAANIRVVMLTGDNSATAAAVARKLDTTEVGAEILPDDKSKIV